MEIIKQASSPSMETCDITLNRPNIALSHDSDYVTNQVVEKSQRIKIWQQTHYLSDSGIHSAIGTHTPSISSKLGIDEVETDDPYLHSNPNHIPQWYNFSSSVNPTESSLLSPATPSSCSIFGVDSISDIVGGSHSASNMDLRGNKLPEIDTDEAASAIPELVKLIKDEDDQVIIYQSAMMVFQLSKSEAIDALIKSWDMLNCIISALDRTEDPETVRFLAGTLYNISQTQIGLKAIFTANCIPCLAKLLNSSVESVLFYAITTLHNLLLHQNGAKAIIRQSGCLQKMITLLSKNNIKFLTICTDCLQILAYAHQESKLQILSSGGPSELVRILRSYQYEKLLWTTARVLKVLSVCPSNKPAIIAAGGMNALAKHLHSSSHRLVLNCLWALRNLSDAATRLDNLQPLLHSLVQLLDCGDSSMVICAAGILSNLTCNNHANKFIVYKMGGIDGLLRAISLPGIKEDILEPCMCALRHLTSRHEEEETARHIIVHGLSALPILSRILRSVTSGICPDLNLACQSPQNLVTSWMLVKAMVGLLRNISVNLDSHNSMRECGLVTGLFILLYATQNEINKRTISNASSQPPFATFVQSVRLEEIIEGICGALHMLAKDHITRSYFSSLKVPNLNISPNIQPGFSGLTLFIELLHSPHESIQRAAAGVLAEVSQDRDGLETLVNIPNASARFNELVHSRNEAISTYASAVVIRLTEERRDIDNTAYMFSSHVESLNTPPLFMDTGEMDCVSTVQHSHNLGNSSNLQSSHPIWTANLDSQSFSQNMQITSGSPPPNSLMEMLGPLPSGCKNSICNDCCSYCGSDCRPFGVCSDPNCIYSNSYSGTYSELQPFKANQNGRLCTRNGSTGCGLSYSQLTPQFSSQPLPSTYETIDTLPSNNSLVGVGVPMQTIHKSSMGSMNTSGYISPVSEIYVQQQQQPCYKPISQNLLLRHSHVEPNHISVSSSLPPLQHSLSAGYLSPDLMTLEECDSTWSNAGPSML